MKKIIFIIILGLLTLGLIFALSKKVSENTDNSSKIQIAASFYPMYFFTNKIGGNKTNVINITPAGAEPHDYDLTPQNIIQIQESKLLVLNGIVEPWANKIKENLKGKDIQTLIAGQDLTTEQIEEDGALVNDPHVWLSPTLAKLESQKVANTLITIDPSNSDYYKTNEINLENELDKINESYKTGLKDCQTKSFVTSHAAFGYLSKDYGLTQVAIDGLAPDEEPSLQKLAQITNFVKDNNVKYIFFESLVSPKLSQTIADEVGSKTLVLDPIEGITDENLSKGVSYLTLMQTNLQNLRIALQCK